MKKVRPWCGQPSDRGRLKAEQNINNYTGCRGKKWEIYMYVPCTNIAWFDPCRCWKFVTICCKNLSSSFLQETSSLFAGACTQPLKISISPEWICPVAKETENKKLINLTIYMIVHIYSMTKTQRKNCVIVLYFFSVMLVWMAAFCAK